MSGRVVMVEKTIVVLVLMSTALWRCRRLADFEINGQSK